MEQVQGKRAGNTTGLPSLKGKHIIKFLPPCSLQCPSASCEFVHVFPPPPMVWRNGDSEDGEHSAAAGCTLSWALYAATTCMCVYPNSNLDTRAWGRKRAF